MGSEQKAIASKFNLKLGFATLQVEVAPVRRSGVDKETSLTYACPKCHGSMQGAQRYVCPAGCGSFQASELDRARGEVVLAADEVAALNDSGEKGVIDLHVCPREELMAQTLPSKNVYRLRLNDTAMAETYDIFRQLAEHPTLALYGTSRISGNIKTAPYLLTTRHGQLVLQSLIRPQDIAPGDELPAVDPNPKMLKMATDLMEALADPLDLTVFTDDRKAKLEQIMAAKGESIEEIEAAPIEENALLAALERSLLASKGKKAA